MLTITLNPSVDIRYNIDNFKTGGVFRTSDFEYTPGGKGLNVTKVITALNERVLATGFLGGNSGQFIKSKLVELNINHKFLPIRDNTRQCIAILSTDGSQTEILEPGPLINEKARNEFFSLYETLLKDVEVVCASGSLPKGLAADTYKILIEKANKLGKKFILDTSGEALVKGIEAKPYLIKPNKSELESLIGKKITSEEDVIASVVPLLNKGIEFIVVSLGGNGSLVFNDQFMYRITLPQVEVKNPVGSGDSMIAGFAVALKRDYDTIKMLRLATACGTANAMEKETGKIALSNINYLSDLINIEKHKI